MYRKFTLSMQLTDQTGHVYAARSALLGPEVIVYGERFVDEIKMGVAFIGSPSLALEQTARLLHERKLRKVLLVETCTQLGYQLADYLEDSEGWNGERRRDIIKGIK